ncbi:MAG: protein kinase [Bradymonadales bacterium]|nr:protein kinase [Bradymonadales bacterium]
MEPRTLERLFMEETRATITCPHCGSQLDLGARYCGFCGKAAFKENSRSDPYLGQMVAGRYRIKKRIAEGGMGEVYIAEHETLPQRVAVKLLHRKFATDEKLVARFFNEARTHSRVKHPNAVTLLDFGRLNDGTLYLVTQFIEGISLTDLVQEHTVLPPALALRLGIQIAEVLAAAHAEQVVHRDLKPDNILVSEGPGERYTANVIDFGIAKILDDGECRLTQTGAVFGTPEYMSPEQAQGLDVSFATDTYSLGCILFFMLSGHPPFEDKNRARLIQRQIKDPPPMEALFERDDLPGDLVRLVQKCLQKEPSARPANALDVLSRLEEITPRLPDLPAKSTGPSRSSSLRGSTTEPDEVKAANARLAEEQTLELKAPQKGSGEWEQALTGQPISPLSAHAEPDFSFGPAPVHKEEEEYSWGDEAESPMGKIIDVDPMEFSPAGLKRFHVSSAWWVVLLLVGGGLALYFLLFADREDAPAETPDPGGQATLAATAGALDGSGAVPEGTQPPGQPTAATLLAILDSAQPSAASAPGTDRTATDLLATATGANVVPQVQLAPLPDQPFKLVQAAGLAGQAALLLNAANVDSAAQKLATVRALLETPEDQELNLQVARNLIRARELIATAEAALDNNRCRAADEAIVQMRQISPALRRRYLAPLHECNSRAQQTRQQAAADEQQPPAQLEEEQPTQQEEPPQEPPRQQTTRRRPPRSLE